MVLNFFKDFCSVVIQKWYKLDSRIKVILKNIFQFIRCTDMDIQDTANKKYQHYKTVQFYEVLGIARHSETKEEMVVYRGLYHCDKFGKNPWFVRPKQMFLTLLE